MFSYFIGPQPFPNMQSSEEISAALKFILPETNCLNQLSISDGKATL